MAISPQQLTIYLHSAHRAVIFAIAQLSCWSWNWPRLQFQCGFSFNYTAMFGHDDHT